jgi:hypothetical protein
MVQHNHWNHQLISLTSEIDERIPSTSNNQYFILWFDYKYDLTIRALAGTLLICLLENLTSINKRCTCEIYISLIAYMSV